RSVWIGRTNPVRPVSFDRWARRPLPWLAFPALLYGEGARALFLSPGSRAARTGARRSSNRPADRGPRGARGSSEGGLCGGIRSALRGAEPQPEPPTTPHHGVAARVGRAPRAARHPTTTADPTR